MKQEQWANKWEMVRKLGGGGQGTTFEVVNRTDSSLRGVLKLLNDDDNEQARSRMAHEKINLETLGKRGVKAPKFLDANTDLYSDSSVQLYLVMEFVSGKTLDAIIVGSDSGRLSLEKSVDIV